MKFRHQVIFWIVVLMIITFIFGGEGDYVQSFYFGSMLLPVAVGTSFFFNEILVPRYLVSGRYYRFALYFIYSLIVSIWLQLIVVTLSLIILGNYDFGKLNPLTTDIHVLVMIIYLVVFLHAFIQVFLEMKNVRQEIALIKEENKTTPADYVIVRADRKNRKVNLEDILYIESLTDYLKINLINNESIITRETISRMEQKLPSDFLRIHRSFIVAKNRITSYNKEKIVFGEITLPVSRKYKAIVTQILKGNS